MKLSLVVPLRMLPGERRDLRRLRRLLMTPPPEVDMLVVDDTLDPAATDLVRAAVARRPGARHIPSPDTAAGPFSIGRLRDIGADAAADGAVMFHDVDFTAPREMYRLLTAGLLDRRLGEAAFFCVPVAFLTPIGTATYLTAPRRTWGRVHAGGERGAPTLSRRLVLGSSAIVAVRRELIAVGGHDPTYVGHGAEDFDLMHRLLVRAGARPRAPDYAQDYGSRAAHLGGFRAVFAQYGRPALAQGLMLVHLWHPPRRGDPRYYAARARNFQRLIAALNR